MKPIFGAMGVGLSVLLSACAIQVTEHTIESPSRSVLQTVVAPWSMKWDGTAVPLGRTVEEGGSDPRFYKTATGVYFEVTSPGGDPEDVSVHRSITLAPPIETQVGARSVLLSLNGHFGSVTVGSRTVGRREAVDLPAGESLVIELHDVRGKTWGTISDPAPR